MSSRFDSKDLIMGGGVVLVLGIGIVVIAILTVVGMGYATSVAFDNKKWEDLSTSQKNFVRMAMVIYWMSFISMFLYNVYVYFTNK